MTDLPVREPNSVLVNRRVEIYESDAETPFWIPQGGVVPVIDGAINVDQTRAERRTLDITLVDNEGALKHDPYDGFWYDKIVKVFRGTTARGVTRDFQVGEFMIDGIGRPHFPNTVKITGRDYTKKLLTSKLRRNLTVGKGTPVVNVIRDTAINGGISPYRLLITPSGDVLGRKLFYDRGTDRWQVIKDLADNYGLEVYFDRNGYLVVRKAQDPIKSAIAYQFKTGPRFGNLATYDKQANDTRIRNHFIVTGESTDTPPVWYSLVNSEPTSPTNINRLGYRTEIFSSPLITTVVQARYVAFQLMYLMAQEEFTLSMQSIVVPWLEAGSIVEFIDPNPGVADPTRFLLSSFNIPMALAGMDSQAKRITRVGGDGEGGTGGVYIPDPNAEASDVLPDGSSIP